jgi:probable HAF family extracellular repeat protein
LNVRGVNNLGHVGGYSYVPAQIFDTGQAFIWKNGQMTALPTLSGWTTSFGFSINDLDEVAGAANRRDDNGHVRQTAVVWDHGQPRNLGTLLPNSQSSASDVNIFGVAVGHSFSLDTFIDVPVVWYGGSTHQLPLLPGESQGAAEEINALGVIVGWQWEEGFNQIACIWYWNGNGYTAVNLGTAGGAFNQGLGINNLSQAVGWTNFVGDEHGPGFVWDFVHGLQFLNPLPSDTDGLAFGINDIGQVLGLSVLATPDDFEVHSVIWQGGTPTDLQTLVPPDTPPFTFGVSNINNLGDIALDATDPDGNPIALLLVPRH